MLVTSTVMFLGLAMWSGVDLVRLVVGRRTVTPAQRLAARQRTKFLLGFALILTVIYGVYLMTPRH